MANLLIDLRIEGEYKGVLESPDGWTIQDGVLELFRSNEHGDMRTYLIYNLSICERIQVISDDEAEELIALNAEPEDQYKEKLAELSEKGINDPFRSGGKLRTKPSETKSPSLASAPQVNEFMKEGA